MGFRKKVTFFIKRVGEGTWLHAGGTLADSQREKDPNSPTETAEGSFFFLNSD